MGVPGDVGVYSPHLSKNSGVPGDVGVAIIDDEESVEVT